MCQQEKGFELATADAAPCSPPKRRELEAVYYSSSYGGWGEASVMIVQFTCREDYTPALALGIGRAHN